jgi:hypothetical protein
LQALLQYTVSSCADARGQGSTQQQQQAPFDPFLQEQELAAALHVGEGFDSEQVWLQLDMQLAPLRKRLRKLLGQIDGSGDGAAAAGLRLVPVEVEEGIDAVLEGTDSDSGSGSEGDEAFRDGDDDDGDEEMMGSDLQDGEGEEDEGHRGKTAAAAAAAGGRRKPLPTEDRCVGEHQFMLVSCIMVLLLLAAALEGGVVLRQ